ncbi:D-alanyl-D-alanine carboxypeptidase-like protein [Kineococcus xinjiangensis]|uniref:D-alanyl-D-alanine carboxypeptidase-like protein n=1 Tax=Kineococcus xinjiangensis TaxID=512762 RepID=A0A2S6ICN9_9ACTN|nr:M15 family metallopeptidase [Kineococcus xinjiangensis]PPK91985.1 D-alanyl-D-alanine carboxypeptidase-like protein [Kineococcus xinjiangensis]
MPTRLPARHRAPGRPLTPLDGAAVPLRRGAVALGRRTAVVAASSGLAFSLSAAAPAHAPAAPVAAGTQNATAGVPASTAAVSAAFTAAPAAAVSAPAGAPAPVSVDPAFATLPAAPVSRDAEGAPLELVDFGNGEVPEEVLHGIGQDAHVLWGPAAAAFQRMQAAAAADGVELRVTDSYRSYGEQVGLARRKGIYGRGGWAARPGTSNHGWGLSVDIDVQEPVLTWLRTRAAEFGFEEDVPREPWHWTYTA